MLRSVLFAVALVVAVPVHAGGSFKVIADQPTAVRLNGEDVGQTPLVREDLRPGAYELEVENQKSGKTVRYHFVTPRVSRVDKSYEIRWDLESTSMESKITTPLGVESVESSRSHLFENLRTGRFSSFGPADAAPFEPSADSGVREPVELGSF